MVAAGLPWTSQIRKPAGSTLAKQAASARPGFQPSAAAHSTARETSSDVIVRILMASPLMPPRPIDFALHQSQGPRQIAPARMSLSKQDLDPHPVRARGRNAALPRPQIFEHRDRAARPLRHDAETLLARRADRRPAGGPHKARVGD